ncbi:MAG: LVIVD repeat-containing protein [Candidatus Dormibacter sp.]|nr:MAG: hypothetical protein DLM66_10385 [Candidatus Dormibacteraeota bacterium]
MRRTDFGKTGDAGREGKSNGSRSTDRLVHVAAVALAAVLALSGLLLVIPAAADSPASLQEVGHDDLGARGLNSALALAGHCAYIGSRGQGAIEIVDVTDPAHLRTVGSLPARRLTTPRELRTVLSRKLLVVLSYALGSGGLNRLDLYSWQGDCAQPVLVGGYDFAVRSPHEFYLWQQSDGDRLLLFTTMFSGGGADLQVVDATDPASPKLAGTWSPPLGSLHSIALSGDGRRAYLSLWRGGLLIADSTQFVSGQPNPQLSLLTPASSALAPLPGGNVHSAVQLPGRDLVIVTDERYLPTAPCGPARLVDVSNPAQPRQVSVLKAPENESATCPSSPVGTYTSHNPTVVGDLAFVTWYSSGLQVFDVSNPAQPVRLAESRPQAVEPGGRDSQLGATLTMTWSYPIVRDGLIYVADINQGLYVLRYQGPHQEQVAQIGFAEGNSNLQPAQAAPTPTPSAVPPPTSPTTPTSGVTRVSPSPAAARLLPTSNWWAGAILILLAAGAAAAFVLVRRSRRPG